ncbi:MAG: sulfatase [Planctomycetota bacterium]
MIRLLVFVSLLGPAVAQEASRPNVLWLIAEDMGPELGCLGTPECRTPNLDRLASKGRLFTRAFTVTPVCSTSRSSLMTGMYATTIGAHNHRSHRGDGFRLPAGVELLTSHLRREGYTPANIRHVPEADWRGTGKTDWNFAVDEPAFDTDRWEDLKEKQPFFAQINFPETHRGGEWNDAHERIDSPADPGKVAVPPYYPDHPEVREDWAQYLNSVMALDAKIGLVLDRLEEDGLAERTIVMFFADHGRAMVRGKQWPYDSGLHVPLIVHWPEGLDRPAGWTEGTRDDRLVASIDITATTLALCGIEIPMLMQGRVFLGPEAAPPRRYVFGARDRCDETVFRIRTVRDARYRYLRNFYPERPFLQLNRYKEWSYPMLGVMRALNEAGRLEGPPAVLFAPRRPKEELYDLENDPHEIRNLAGSEEHARELERLRAALDTWIVETNDQGRFEEPPEVIAEWETKMKKAYDAKLKRRAEK